MEDDHDHQVSSNMIKVWFSVIASLCYCYAVGNLVSKGTKRFFFILPVVCLFLYLPLHISLIFFRGFSAFFIAWLANFKLLLFAFGLGPLGSDPSLSLPSFVALACLPIKIQQTQESLITHGQRKSPLNYSMKALLFVILMKVYGFRDQIHPWFISFLFGIIIYTCLETVLAALGFLVQLFSGLEIEAQFDEPYLSTSLHEFWSKRWNLMVPAILRPAVYIPVRHSVEHLVGKEFASAVASMASFLVSAVMHDLMFFYLGCETPTWHLTCFFLLHGFCVTVEIALKKKKFSGGFRIPKVISGFLTIGFVVATGIWLFLPRLYSCKLFETAVMEYARWLNSWRLEDAIRRNRIYAAGTVFL